MKLTTQLLSAFVGGQFEVQNANEGYIYRGEIKTVEVIGEELAITFNWMAQGKDFPHLPTGWVNDPIRIYEADLSIYEANDIGPGSEGGDTRICIQSSIIGETGVFYPPNGSKLNPAEVVGLELSVAQ
jgi:hypothetical protein